MFRDNSRHDFPDPPSFFEYLGMALGGIVGIPDGFFRELWGQFTGWLVSLGWPVFGLGAT